MKIAFCAYRVSPALAQRAEFYKQDLLLLRDLGHDVTLVSSPWCVAARRFDVAFVWWWNYLCLWVPKFRLVQTPIVVTGTYDLASTMRWPTYKAAVKHYFARFPDAHLFVSRYERDAVSSFLALDPSRVRYAPLVVDTSIYKCAESPVSRRCFHVANVSWQGSKNARRKMLPQLLHAFAAICAAGLDAFLTLAGPHGDGTKQLMDLAKHLGVSTRVDFPGELDVGAKIRLMQQCSVYCQVSEFEGFGLAIAEAMACGAPVLVSKVGAVPEVVSDVGHYVEPTVDGIRDGLVECWRAEETKERRLARAAHIATKFSPDRRRAALRETLGSVIKGPSGISVGYERSG